MLEQGILVPDFCRCDECGRDVERTRKTRRFRLCDDCWARVVPDFEGKVETPEQRTQLAAYWKWYWEIERRHPRKRSAVSHRPSRTRHHDTDDYWPYCECGNERRAYTLPGSQPGLFGGPFHHMCPVCEARAAVESVFHLAGAMPNRDEEEWLDLMYRSHPEAFEVGVLPDYWFELKLRAAKQLLAT